MNKVKSLIWNYIWLAENGESHCKTKVKWTSFIQTHTKGGIKLIDPALQMQALLAKLIIRRLILGAAPWKILMQCRMQLISSNQGEN